MATLFNNTEITNAFFNGTELDKIYFNGVLVFEKGGKYKRRIMVGDDLKGKTIYMDSITSQEIQETYNNYGLYIENLYNIIEAPNFAIYDIYREHWEGLSEYPPSYEILSWGEGFIEYDKDLDKITIINNKITVPSDSNKNYIVTSIDRRMTSSSSPVSNDNHKTYRHFFIEDENIRPFEVGDIVLPNTKIYFNIPDNYFYEEWTSQDNQNGKIIQIQKNGASDSELPFALLTSWFGGSNFKLVSAKLQPAGFSSYEQIYYINSNGVLEKNDSYKEINQLQFGTDFEGEVIEVNKNHSAYQHILVDTRTLGTTGYKRRIMIGDNLNNKVIYTDFPTEQDEILNYYIYLRENVYMKDGLVFLTTSTENWSFYEGYESSSPLNETSTGGIVVDNQTVFTLSPANGDYFPEETQAYIHTSNISSITCSNSAGIVETIVNTNPSYKRLYIEDPKIRPIQVGDKIVEGTKFYFNFPDDLYINLTNYKVDWIIKIENENGDIIGIAASTDEENRTIAARREKHNVTGVYIGTAFYSHYTPFGTTDKELEINSSHDIAKNILVDRQDSTLHLLGTVSEINTTYADIYKYILVDITTLG